MADTIIIDSIDDEELPDPARFRLANTHGRSLGESSTSTAQRTSLGGWGVAASSSSDGPAAAPRATAKRNVAKKSAGRAPQPAPKLPDGNRRATLQLEIPSSDPEAEEEEEEEEEQKAAPPRLANAIDIDDTESDSSAGPDPLALRPAPSPAKRPRPLPALPTAVNASHSLPASSSHSLPASSSHSHPNRSAPSSRDDNTPRRPPHAAGAAPSSSNSAPSPRPSSSKQPEVRGSSPQVEPPYNTSQSFASALTPQQPFKLSQGGRRVPRKSLSMQAGVDPRQFVDHLSSPEGMQHRPVKHTVETYMLDLTLDSGDEEAIADDPRMEQQLLEEEHDRVQEELDRRPSPFLSTPPPEGECASPTRPEFDTTQADEESSESEARAPRLWKGKGKARKSTSSKAPVKKAHPSLSGATRPAVRESRWEEIVISSSDEDEGVVQEREGEHVTGTEEALSSEDTPMEAELELGAVEAVEAEKVAEAAADTAEAMDIDHVQAELSSKPEQQPRQAGAELDETPMVEDATPSAAASPAPAVVTAGSGDAIVEDPVDDQDQVLAVPSKPAVAASAPRATRPRGPAKAGAVNERPSRTQKSKVAPKKPVAAVQTPKVEQDDSPAGIQRRIETFVERQRREKPRHRQLAGPSFPGEFALAEDIVRQVQERDDRFERINKCKAPGDPLDAELWEAMAAQVNAAEIDCAAAEQPRIRVVPPAFGQPPYAPPFELIYTHRVPYAAGIVPEQAPGCDCEGDCGSPENLKGCACRERQQRASRGRSQLRDPALRSGVDGFAYTPNGVLREELRVGGIQDPVMECNSECGCSSSCINRVVGQVPRTSVDIVWSGPSKGWSLVNPLSYTYEVWEGHEALYEEKTIPCGTPMGIYGSELLAVADGHAREHEYYGEVGRNYLFDLDHVSILESLRLRQPDVTSQIPFYEEGQPSAGQALENLLSTKGGRRTVKSWGKARFDKLKKAAILAEESKPSIDDTVAEFTLDAFFFGNWTRFANHSCSRFNAEVRPVYVDEGDIRRPLYVFFATRDIEPGDEIAITYHGDMPHAGGLTIAQYKAKANKMRKEAEKGWRCFCGEDLCRGIMFRWNEEEEQSAGEGEAVAGSSTPIPPAKKRAKKG